MVFLDVVLSIWCGKVPCILLSLMATNDWSSWNSQTCPTLQPSECSVPLSSTVTSWILKKRFDFVSLASEATWIMIHSLQFRMMKRPWLQSLPGWCRIAACQLSPQPWQDKAEGLLALHLGTQRDTLYFHTYPMTTVHHCSNSSSMSSDQQAGKRHTPSLPWRRDRARSQASPWGKSDHIDTSPK